MADSGRTRAAADGSAASFSSLGGFGDVRGFGVATEYLSERSNLARPESNGWSTYAITPHQDSLAFAAVANGQEPLWLADFSTDLSKGVFQAYSVVTSEDPTVVNVRNLYQRDDLRTSGAGHYRLITACPACSTPIPPPTIFQFAGRKPQLAGTSSNFEKVLFKSTIPLTLGASGTAPKLYEWSAGTLQLVDVLPDSACGLPPCHAGGETAAGNRPISSDGSRIVFTDTGTGQVYERVDGIQTMTVSASERTDCADHDPCGGTPEPDPSGSQPITVRTSSVDGSRVFFLTLEQLTDDDDNTTVDLYMWDANGSAGHRLTRISVDRNPVDGPGNAAGVFGASDDGHYVYFVASGQLVAGKPDLGGVARGIYVWHDGAASPVAYVGQMAGPGDDTNNLLPGPPFGAGIRSHVTPDGAHLLFVSRSGAGLLSEHGGVDYDQTRCGIGCEEFYLYSAATDSLVCASCMPDGSPATAGTEDVVRDGTGASSEASHVNHPLSDDGHWVFFHTVAALVAGDSNGKNDVYEYDAATSTIQLISSGIDAAGSSFLDASADGKNVFFVTREQFVGWDTDASYDLYDARVGGGFPDPAPPSLACLGEACRNAASPPPAADVGSSLFRGVGDLKVTIKERPKFKARPKPKTKRCKRGFVRKRVRGKFRCVKKPRTKHAKSAAVKGSAR